MGSDMPQLCSIFRRSKKNCFHMQGSLQSVLGIIDTEHYGYGELFNEINVHTGGIGTSLELYTDVTKVEEKKEFRATFEIKGKALYPKLDVLFCHDA